MSSLIYIISLWSIFYFQSDLHCRLSYNVIKSDAIVFCTFFRIDLIFVVENVDEESE